VTICQPNGQINHGPTGTSPNSRDEFDGAFVRHWHYGAACRSLSVLGFKVARARHSLPQKESLTKQPRRGHWLVMVPVELALLVPDFSNGTQIANSYVNGSAWPPMALHCSTRRSLLPL
jgi:hypothetical protein